MTRRHLRPSALAVLVAAVALALAACAGGSSTPQVASLGTSASPGAGSDPGTTASPGTGSGSGGRSTPDVTPLLNEWAACERSNGDPEQTDPTVDANGVIYSPSRKGPSRLGTSTSVPARAASTWPRPGTSLGPPTRSPPRPIRPST